jgi:hypothetical protein
MTAKHRVYLSLPEKIVVRSKPGGDHRSKIEGPRQCR